MNTVLYFSTNGAVYETRAYSTADIDALVSDHALQSLSSADHQFDFWFSPTTRRCQRRVNRRATELLLATTSFTAKNVPLLYGCVVIASHDEDGDLDGLSWQQLDLLVARSRSLTTRDGRVLNRRINREDARAQRAVAAVAATAVSCARTRTPVRH
ncbi:hypothetical protein [Mycobacterium sp. SMC-4]|uniref:hypothetical protein n=1 Tax=Mycobacterium sp. SMC-4 TaxID=2857059 RepID=UPI0021B3C1E8|nr:hypothetical protein [Mycobacterium sp. SMC-4]UXA17996.1 hypothetical protein KXD98_25560 [Mycobacterium sp. SMC-4]